MTPEVLETVTTIEQVKENLRRFARDAEANVSRARSLAALTEYWIYDPELDAYGPGKFVGFANMTFPRYELAANGGMKGVRFNGGITRRQLGEVVGPFSQDVALAAGLTAWLEGPPVRADLSGVDPSKWQFSRLPVTRNYWSLACNPDRFDGLAAAQALDEMVWTVGTQDIAVGDAVLVWQVKGSGQRRGVIALGVVTAAPVMLPTPNDEKPFWRAAAPDIERRIRFRQISAPGLPLWESAIPELAASLAVARARGGTVFSLEPQQWRQILQLCAAEGSVASVARPTSGAGRLSDVAIRRAVERQAERRAEEYFTALGFEVTNVGLTECYDLRCVRGAEELRVEVKGTTGSGGAVTLTANEVTHARENADRVALFVLSGIKVDATSDGPVGTAGKATVFHPWEIEAGELTAIQFTYRISVRQESLR